jgi:hypothetical protein
VSVKDILREIEALPSEERWTVLEGVRRLVEPEIPASFREGMEQIKRGEGIDLDDALRELDGT